MFDKINALLQQSESYVRKKLPLLILALFTAVIIIGYLLLWLISPETKILQVIIPAGILLLFIMLHYTYSRVVADRYRTIRDALEKELDYLKIMIGNTDELILILDSFGQIIIYNDALSRALNIKREELTGKPLREIFYLPDMGDNLNYKNIILDKLKEVFTGNEAEIIFPVMVKGSDLTKSIFLKLKPHFEDNELTSIFANGRIMESDFITNSWLLNETSNYIMDNDISKVMVFCYRLTRNLEGKIPSNDILFMQVALHEIIVNAIEHGNLEITYEKKTEFKQRRSNYWEIILRETNENHLKYRKIFLNYSLEKDRVTYTVRDEGKGFDWKKYIHNIDFDGKNEMVKSFHGLGLLMVKNSFDEIHFNDRGNEVELIKYFDPGTVVHD